MIFSTFIEIGGHFHLVETKPPEIWYWNIFHSFLVTTIFPLFSSWQWNRIVHIFHLQDSLIVMLNGSICIIFYYSELYLSQTRKLGPSIQLLKVETHSERFCGTNFFVIWAKEILTWKKILRNQKNLFCTVPVRRKFSGVGSRIKQIFSFLLSCFQFSGRVVCTLYIQLCSTFVFSFYYGRIVISSDTYLQTYYYSGENKKRKMDFYHNNKLFY